MKRLLIVALLVFPPASYANPIPPPRSRPPLVRPRVEGEWNVKWGSGTFRGQFWYHGAYTLRNPDDTSFPPGWVGTWSLEGDTLVLIESFVDREGSRGEPHTYLFKLEKGRLRGVCGDPQTFTIEFLPVRK